MMSGLPQEEFISFQSFGLPDQGKADAHGDKKPVEAPGPGNAMDSI